MAFWFQIPFSFAFIFCDYMFLQYYHITGLVEY